MLPVTAVNFAIGGEQRSIEILDEVQEGPEKREYPRAGCKLLQCLALWRMSQAAWGAGSSSEPFTVKYRSKVLMAASKTMWQSEQESRWRLISLATGGESLPSKYQQIK
jgi:hypothetical protein